MQTSPNSFEVTVRRRVPYLTTFLFYALMVCVIALFLINIFFLPTQYASAEMKTAYFILLTPDFIKNSLLVFGIGFLTITPFYTFLRLYRKAYMIFNPDNILLSGQNVNICIPIKTISKVYCMDARRTDGQPKEKFTIFFQQKRDKSIRVKLKKYEQAESVITQMAQYVGLNVNFYDFDVNPASDEED